MKIWDPWPWPHIQLKLICQLDCILNSMATYTEHQNKCWVATTIKKQSHIRLHFNLNAHWQDHAPHNRYNTSIFWRRRGTSVGRGSPQHSKLILKVFVHVPNNNFTISVKSTQLALTFHYGSNTWRVILPQIADLTFIYIYKNQPISKSPSPSTKKKMIHPIQKQGCGKSYWTS